MSGMLEKAINHRNMETQMSEMKIVFMEGCFDDFEGTQDELNELIADLNKQLQDGSLLLNAEPLSEEDEQALIEKFQDRRQKGMQ